MPPDATSLDDPVVHVDVLSKGSAQRDRWEKWALYQRLLSLRHYARVERDQLAVDIFDRVEGGFFERPRLAAAVDVLRLPAVGFELSLAQIYRDVISG